MNRTKVMSEKFASVVVGVAGLMCSMAGTLCAADPADYYTEPPYYLSRPDPKLESYFGQVGVTGLKLRVYPGVVLKVEETIPGTPADGKFTKGDIVTGVNGVAHKGRNPFVFMGNALTEAEAKDGKLVFDVLPAEGKTTKQVTVTIPVLGAYSPTWPLNCEKSKAIITNAAKYYSQMKDGGVEGGLACLFLLSTGDDQYLPVVKAYFDKMSGNINGIGDHTWSNGYNGIACGEYYLRTGDKSVLPVMQYFCDDARDRQMYGIGWTHWGKGVSPSYVAGGLLNAAGAQLVTTLLLGKECGVKVDEKTLAGALRFFYRFAGRASVAYGDHRPEGWLGSSNGKDGMVAAMMQVACGAKGDTESYRKARNYLALGTAVSDDVAVIGHGDEGRGDAIWRGLTTSYMLDVKPAEYHSSMNRLRWLYDLSRRPSGALGVATCPTHDTEGSGAGPVLAYTAPLKSLRITGAPRSKFSKDFTLPQNPWGRKADLEFLSLENAKPYSSFGSSEPEEKAYMKLWNTTYKNTPYPGSREEMLKNVYHWNISIRTMAARLLMHAGEFVELEKLLQDKDARIRRAALDGLTDYDFWGGMGRNPIRTEHVSPAMLASIRKMLADPNESLFVLDGALMAMSRAPAPEIAKSLPVILPLATCDEWWIRDSAARALAVAAQEESVRPKVLTVLGEMLLRENRAWARGTINGLMSQLASTFKPDSASGKQIIALFKRGTEKGTILPGPRSEEGGYYIKELVLASLNSDPESALQIARAFKTRLPELKTDYITGVVNAFLPVLEKLPTTDRQALTDLLFGEYRQELIKRAKSDDSLLDPLVTLAQLKRADLGWKDMGRPISADRIWQFLSIEPQAKDILPLHEGRRFRDITLPAGLEKWYMPEFDVSKWSCGKWSSGKAPIGIGVFKEGGKQFQNQSAWGDGEFLMMRTTFEVDSLDYDYIRIGILAIQGYRLYLNGQEIHSYAWWNYTPMYAPLVLKPDQLKHLKKGTNVLAFIAVAAVVNPNDAPSRLGQADLRLEGLKKADLFKK